MGSRQLDELVKRGGIVDGDVGERLPVQFDQCPLQPGDKLAVAQAPHATGGVDANDPQATEVALANAPVAVGVDAGADQGDERLPIEVVAAEAKALGQLLQTFAASRDGLAAARACHGLLTPLDLRSVSAAHDLDVLLGDQPRLDDRVAQLSLALAGLVAVQVLLAGLAAFELAGAGDLEPFLGRLVRLLLRHDTPPCGEWGREPSVVAGTGGSRPPL